MSKNPSNFFKSLVSERCQNGMILEIYVTCVGVFRVLRQRFMLEIYVRDHVRDSCQRFTSEIYFRMSEIYIRDLCQMYMSEIYVRDHIRNLRHLCRSLACNDVNFGNHSIFTTFTYQKLQENFSTFWCVYLVPLFKIFTTPSNYKAAICNILFHS